jgi:hypothetical protein
VSDNKPEKIFSGDASQELWDEINSIDAMSTGDDIHGVLYSLGCAMQRLEGKFDDAIHKEGGERDALVEALEKLARLGNGDIYGNSDGNIIAQKALTTHRD